MSPFWGSLFDALRGRGRNAALFIAAFLLLLGFLLVTAQIPREVYTEYVLPALPFVVLLLLPWCIRSWRQAGARRRERVAQGRLSRDELNKARSKLVKGQMRKTL